MTCLDFTFILHSQLNNELWGLVLVWSLKCKDILIFIQFQEKRREGQNQHCGSELSEQNNE